MLRPVVEDNKNQTVYDTNNNTKIPFPDWRIKTLKKKEVQNKKDEGNFYKVNVDENSQGEGNNMTITKNIYKSNEKMNRPAIFGDAAESELEASQNYHPDRPQNQLWRPIEKSTSDANMGFNKLMSQNLDKINEVDIKLIQTDNGFQVEKETDLMNMDNMNPSKWRQAPKTKKVVYKSKDLFEREQNLPPHQGISRPQSKDSKLVLDPIVESNDLRYNDGNTFRIDPKVEVYRRKRLEFKMKQDEKRSQEKKYAAEGLKMKLNQ